MVRESMNEKCLDRGILLFTFFLMQSCIVDIKVLFTDLVMLITQIYSFS